MLTPKIAVDRSGEAEALKPTGFREEVYWSPRPGDPPEMQYLDGERVMLTPDGKIEMCGQAFERVRAERQQRG